MKALFLLGRLFATPGALAAAEEAGDNLITFFMRHERGEWGDLSAADKSANDRALVEGTRVLSAYHLKDGTKIYVITEWDRSYTTVMLADDY